MIDVLFFVSGVIFLLAGRRVGGLAAASTAASSSSKARMQPTLLRKVFNRQYHDA
ncbi:hypothetical protein D3C86_2241900 [compost metagenome]